MNVLNDYQLTPVRSKQGFQSFLPMESWVHDAWGGSKQVHNNSASSKVAHKPVDMVLFFPVLTKIPNSGHPMWLLPPATTTSYFPHFFCAHPLHSSSAFYHHTHFPRTEPNFSSGLMQQDHNPCWSFPGTTVIDSNNPKRGLLVNESSSACPHIDILNIKEKPNRVENTSRLTVSKAS